MTLISTRIIYHLILLALATCSVRGQFNFCRLLRGICRDTCPITHVTLFRAPILCNSNGFCCIRRRRSPENSIKTTTTAATTTRRPTIHKDCGIKGPISRIIGGRDAERCEFPWSVYINREGSPCGATLVDDRHIITAGHCLSKVTRSQLTIRVGEHNTRVTIPWEEFTVTDYRIFIPPSYRQQYYVDDIAIIKLNNPIKWSRYNCIAPICLPERWRRFRNMKCTVTGWGVTRTNFTYRNPPLANVLQKVNIDIVDESICRRKFGERFFRDTNYCAGALEGGRDSCGGDSGGPLMCRGRDNRGRFKVFLAGLVSTGADCAVPNTPAIYTDVAKYRRWIDSVIATP